ncbi:glutathionylspermidine synthase family protein [Priestia flexa]|uniref:glutathionylspermidine synthase family protein n=1 Tax=Priestia flexa TaxID=86664 RepID=UPI002E1DAF01|nr:glutathionylspermidine synthase family protein [Priestia flexa]
MESLLEYRLLKLNETYTSIYHYESIELEQVLARRECEFFVKEVLPYIRLQTMEVETVISRIDFIVNESGIKVMELNADTPTFIKELFHVNRRVCKQFGLHDPNQKEEEHLSRVLKEAIFKAYEKLGKTTYPHIVFSSHGDHEEDKWTTTYLMEQANVKARYEPLDKLRIVDKPIHEQGELILEPGLYVIRPGRKLTFFIDKRIPLNT